MRDDPKDRVALEEEINALAARQHGVVTREQLLAAGLSAQMLNRRLKGKRVQPLHRGVYRIGPVVATYASEMAAILCCGESAVVSHRSAAGVWRLPDDHRPVPVQLILREGHRRRPEIRIHRSVNLRADEVTTFERIPLTTVARTLLDISHMVPARTLERALAEAFNRRLTDGKQLDKLLIRHPHARGTARLRRLLAAGSPAFTRSEAEERLLALIRRSQLPAPEVNVVVCGYEVDFYWRAARFVVEVDGFAFHSSSASFESDRRRDAKLAAHGVRVMRVTWRQIEQEPEALAVRLALALSQS